VNFLLQRTELGALALDVQQQGVQVCCRRIELGQRQRVSGIGKCVLEVRPELADRAVERQTFFPEIRCALDQSQFRTA
jgi:hypothetical protein